MHQNPERLSQVVDMHTNLFCNLTPTEGQTMLAFSDNKKTVGVRHGFDMAPVDFYHWVYTWNDCAYHWRHARLRWPDVEDVAYDGVPYLAPLEEPGHNFTQ